MENENKVIHCRVYSGRIGGKWAYWHGEHYVVIDTLYNPTPPYFAGFLSEPYNGTDAEVWIQTDNIPIPPPEPRHYIEDIERSEGRYERNDVDRIDLRKEEEGGNHGE